MAHLVDGIKISYKDDMVTVYDGENKPIIYGKTIDSAILEDFVWLYKLNVEHYQGKYEGLFFDEQSFLKSMQDNK
jgi:hypothetical protein